MSSFIKIRNVFKQNLYPSSVTLLYSNHGFIKRKEKKSIVYYMVMTSFKKFLICTKENLVSERGGVCWIVWVKCVGWGQERGGGLGDRWSKWGEGGEGGGGNERVDLRKYGFLWLNFIAQILTSFNSWNSFM